MKLLLFVTCLISNVICWSQAKTFTLEGKINVDTGKIFLLLDVPEDYSLDSGVKQAFVNKGKFVFKGIIADPLPYKIRWYDTYLSGTFFIEPGIQSVICDTDSLRVTPKITNRSTSDYLYYCSFFAPYFSYVKEVRLMFDSIGKIYNGSLPADALKRKDSLKAINQKKYLDLSKSYMKKRPGSHVLLAELANYLQYGYSPLYFKAYDGQPINLKNTHTGKVLREKLSAVRSIDIGKAFPKLNVLDTAQMQAEIDFSMGKSKYILIDFWYSHCPPCIGQFSAFQGLYKKYSRQQFEIIGISVDKEKDLQDWKNIILKHSLSWTQYLDKNGAIASDFGFSVFPTNFLLNERGVVIGRNVTVHDIEKAILK